MTKFFFRVVASVVFAVLPSWAFAETPAQNWANIRIIVHENKLSGNLQNCSAQHLNEHIYGRMVHASLDKAAKWPFVVHAWTTVDKIVISVNIFAPVVDRLKIQAAIEKGLVAAPSQNLIMAEARLIAIEEQVKISDPKERDILHSQISEILDQKKLIKDCGADPTIPITLYDLRNPTAPDFDIIYFTQQNLPSLTSIYSNKKNIYKNYKSAYIPNDYFISKKEKIKGLSATNILFVSSPNISSAEQHIVAVARILRAGDSFGLKLRDIKPLGIGAFLVHDTPEDLSKLREIISDAVNIDYSVINENNFEEVSKLMLSDRVAQDYICMPPTENYDSTSAWADENVANRYFSFWIYSTVCKQDYSKAWPLRKKYYEQPAEFYTQFLDLTLANKSKSDVPNLKYSMCLNQASHQATVHLDKQIYYRAIRQHFRLDLGLILNIWEKETDNNCIALKFIAPEVNHIEIVKKIANFQINNPKFVRRLHGASADFYCNGDDVAQCAKVGAGKIAELPEDILVFQKIQK